MAHEQEPHPWEYLMRPEDYDMDEETKAQPLPLVGHCFQNPSEIIINVAKFNSRRNFLGAGIVEIDGSPVECSEIVIKSCDQEVQVQLEITPEDSICANIQDAITQLQKMKATIRADRLAGRTLER